MLVLDDGQDQALVGVETANINIYVLHMTLNHKHATALYWYTGFSVNDKLDTSNLKLAKQSKAKKARLEAERAASRAARDVSAAQSQLSRAKKLIRHKEPSYELHVAGKSIAGAAVPKSFYSKQDRVSRAETQSAEALVEFMLDPCSFESNLLIPDGTALTVATHRATKTVTIQPVAYLPTGNSPTYWWSVIHSGQVNAQYMINVLSLPLGLSFCIAKLTTTQSTNSLLDIVSSALQTKSPVPVQILSNSQIPIPLHSAYDTNSSGNGFPYLVQPTEGYNVSGQPFGPNSVSVPAQTVIPFIGCTIVCRVLGNSLANGTVNLTADVLAADSSLTTITLGSVIISGGATTFVMTPNYVNTTYVGLYNIWLTTDSTASLNLSEISITLVTNGTAQLSNSASFILPYGWYQGTPVQAAEALRGIAEFERTTASTLLCSDISNEFTSAGINYVSIVTSSEMPAETGLSGIQGAANNAKAVSLKEKNGFYAAPFKLGGRDKGALTPLSADWFGTQPYTVAYGFVPSTVNQANVNLKLTFTDCFELKCNSSDQLMSKSTCESMPIVMEKVFAAMKNNVFISENPGHFAAIKSFMSRFVKSAPKYIPALMSLAETSGNPYLMGGVKVADRALRAAQPFVQ